MRIFNTFFMQRQQEKKKFMDDWPIGQTGNVCASQIKSELYCTQMSSVFLCHTSEMFSSG